MSRPRVIPPVYLLAAVLLMTALHFLAPMRQLIAWPWRYFGLAVFAAGLGMGGWVVVLFARRKTTIKPGEASTALITDGPFRLSRNPIYVGMVLLLVGVALFMGSTSPWLVIPVFIWILHHNIIPVEEAMLAKTFGDEYQQYRRRVGRWI